ncbi:hypothetical protein HYW20_06700 [Candidatus Woesearchaeota archaeon]|nr:hypothetical protein [Candidatus Woesearchaeota archaeon]
MKQKLSNKNERDYEYQIYVDNKLVWRGLNPEKVYEKIVKENPKKKVAIAWELKEGILIAFI